MYNLITSILFGCLLATSCNTSKKIVATPESASPMQADVAIATPQSSGQRGGNLGNNEAMDAMVESLGLNEEQKAQFDAINAIFSEKMQKKREEARASGSFEGMREEMQKLRKDQNGALKNLLTENQYTIYDEFVKKQQAERQANRSNRGGN